MTPFAYLLSLPIRLYRLVFSPWVGSNCRFMPTCSAYALDALNKHGEAKRRLREISKATLTVKGNPGWDYVLVGRPKTTLERNYSLLIEDLNKAIKKVHS